MDTSTSKLKSALCQCGAAMIGPIIYKTNCGRFTVYFVLNAKNVSFRTWKKSHEKINIGLVDKKM